MTAHERILGAPDIRRLLAPFAIHAAESSALAHVEAWQGEHGMPASALSPALALEAAARHYLLLKLESFSIAPGRGIVIRASSASPLEPEEEKTLAALNAWLQTEME